ncbi:hypothetical protein CYMTET_39137 [Cymbomonas tetramitiformis]|uniref:Uncharacterized protein n=1 Tax=Cymbomonas tetramitiformis TaxID=36881 RepID=A0AAE0F4T1_9CHLO|nr:hypothetical protein CYMTET_39137 [Cymbomonas tetramitiformis]
MALARQPPAMACAAAAWRWLRRQPPGDGLRGSRLRWLARQPPAMACAAAACDGLRGSRLRWLARQPPAMACAAAACDGLRGSRLRGLARQPPALARQPLRRLRRQPPAALARQPPAALARRPPAALNGSRLRRLRGSRLRACAAAACEGLRGSRLRGAARQPPARLTRDAALRLRDAACDRLARQPPAALTRQPPAALARRRLRALCAAAACGACAAAAAACAAAACGATRQPPAAQRGSRLRGCAAAACGAAASRSRRLRRQPPLGLRATAACGACARPRLALARPTACGTNAAAACVLARQPPAALLDGSRLRACAAAACGACAAAACGACGGSSRLRSLARQPPAIACAAAACDRLRGSRLRSLARQPPAIACAAYLVIGELLLSVAIPSKSARAGGVFGPIIAAVAEGDARDERPLNNKLGTYLCATQFQGGSATAALLLTGTPFNVLCCDLARDTVGADVTWGSWFAASSLPVLTLVAIMPAAMHLLVRPGGSGRATASQSLDRGALATGLARDKLEKMGPPGRREQLTLGALVVTVALWSVGESLFGMNNATAGLCGVSLLLLSGVLTWDECLEETAAWDCFLWFAAMIALSSGLDQLGVMAVFSDYASGFASNMGLTDGPALAFLSIIYIYSHYFFASNTAHISAMFPALLLVAVSSGASPLEATLALAISNHIMSGLTHYSSGNAPVYFKLGYCSIEQWWSYGFTMSLVQIVVWLTVGRAWWSMLGILGT